jgi:membrane protein DedA with SNARE-associated domain
MNALVQALKGPGALFVGLGLLYIEEAGIPTPAPGEVFLLGVGLLVATGAVPWWIGVPAAYLAVVAGATTGYFGARLLGIRRLRVVTRRIGLDGVVETASERLQSATHWDVAVSRLIPGLRIVTTLVAGALELRFAVFIRGVLEAAAAWVVGYMAIGFFVGVPAERLVGSVQAFAFRAGGVLAILAIGYFIIRRVPGRAPPSPGHGRPTTRRRRIAAFAVDLATVAGVVALLDALTGLELGNLGAPVTTTVVLTALAILYVAIARRSRGQTLGERLVHG